MDNKLRKLYAIAEEDNVYMVWKRSYEEFAEAFKAFADAQPEDIRNVLWGYAESGRLMMQRMTNIACEKMDYIEAAENKR